MRGKNRMPLFAQNRLLFAQKRRLTGAVSPGKCNDLIYLKDLIREYVFTLNDCSNILPLIRGTSLGFFVSLACPLSENIGLNNKRVSTPPDNIYRKSMFISNKPIDQNVSRNGIFFSS